MCPAKGACPRDSDRWIRRNCQRRCLQSAQVKAKLLSLSHYVQEPTRWAE